MEGCLCLRMFLFLFLKRHLFEDNTKRAVNDPQAFSWNDFCLPPVGTLLSFCLVYRMPLRAARAGSRYTCTLWNVSNFCRLQQLLLLGSSLPCCIQEIGDVNAMKAAYLNDEQIVKAPGSGSWFFRKWGLTLAGPGDISGGKNTRGTLKEQEFRSWVLVTIRCSSTQAQKQMIV